MTAVRRAVKTRSRTHSRDCRGGVHEACSGFRFRSTPKKIRCQCGCHAPSRDALGYDVLITMGDYPPPTCEIVHDVRILSV